MAIYFYIKGEIPYGCFSNFSDHGFELDGLWWPTAEHYFQAQKFTDASYAEKIRLATGPHIAKRLGQTRDSPLRPDWNDVKDDVMRRAVEQKFSTHSDVREVLLSTGDEELVEDAPNDYYWGCGAKRTGKNRLGQILMEVREALRESSL